MRNYSIRALILLALSLSPLACGKGQSGALPAVGFKVSFEKQNIPKEITAGERVTAEISFKNTSPVTWPSKPNAKNKNQVNLSYHWLNSKGEPVVFDGLRTALPNDVKAGESVELKPEILAPDKPGAYILEVTLVQEGVAWFPEKDGDKITVPVRVVAARAGAQGVVAGPKDDAEKKVSGLADENKQGKKSRKEKQREAREKAKVELEKPVGKTISSEKLQQRKPPQPNTVQQKADGLWTVQLAAFTDAKEAGALAKQLKSKGFDSYVVVGQVAGKNWHRVRAGHFSNRAQAEQLLGKLKASENMSGANVVNN